MRVDGWMDGRSTRWRRLGASARHSIGRDGLPQVKQPKGLVCSPLFARPRHTAMPIFFPPPGGLGSRRPRWLRLSPCLVLGTWIHRGLSRQFGSDREIGSGLSDRHAAKSISRHFGNACHLQLGRSRIFTTYGKWITKRVSKQAHKQDPCFFWWSRTVQGSTLTGSDTPAERYSSMLSCARVRVPIFQPRCSFYWARPSRYITVTDRHLTGCQEGTSGWMGPTDDGQNLTRS